MVYIYETSSGFSIYPRIGNYHIVYVFMSWSSWPIQIYQPVPLSVKTPSCTWQFYQASTLCCPLYFVFDYFPTSNQDSHHLISLALNPRIYAEEHLLTQNYLTLHDMRQFSVIEEKSKRVCSNNWYYPVGFQISRYRGSLVIHNQAYIKREQTRNTWQMGHKCNATSISHEPKALSQAYATNVGDASFQQLFATRICD